MARIVSQGDLALPFRSSSPNDVSMQAQYHAVCVLLADEARTDSREGGIDSQEPDEVVQRYSGEFPATTVPPGTITPGFCKI